MRPSKTVSTAADACENFSTSSKESENMRLLRINALLLLLVVSGCGATEDGLQRRTVYPASGTITHAGQPLGEVSVVLHPVNKPDDGKPHFLPRGTSDEHGKFTISTYAQADGAAPGTYQAVFSYQGSLQGLDEDEQDALPELLPRNWTRPELSSVTLVVTEDQNDFETIELY